MVGAIRVSDKPEEHLPLLLDNLYTHWELPVDQRFSNALLKILGNAYGEEWKNKFSHAIELGNYFWNKMHFSPPDSYEYDLDRVVGRLKRQIASKVQRILHHKP